MKIEFLGQGLHNSYSNTVGDWISSTLKDLDYTSFIGFSAFTKMSGINKIKQDLLFAKSNYESIKFYLGIVEKGTSKEALEFLLENNIETWVYCTDEMTMFHPKIYYFSGKHNSRFIIGSSNLTKAGLFENIEASTLLEFSKNDKSGQKFMNQFHNYFKSILTGTEKDTQLLTRDVLNELIESKFVWDESKTSEGFDITNNKFLSKKRNSKKIDDKDFGNINLNKITSSNSNSVNDYIPEITQEYLDSWNEYFELFKDFKKENSYKGEKYSVTVPRDYKNPSLYTWYRRQKIYYKNNMLIPEHKEKLIKEKFYFKDAHKLWGEYKNELKLDLLVQAILDKEDIKISHKYIYKGERLGTWLVGVISKNQFELVKLIDDLGFNISGRINTVENTAKRFIEQLRKAKKSNKMALQSRFNLSFSDNKEAYTKDAIREIEELWELKFNEKREWGKIRERTKDRTDEWKAFRYNKNLNPEGKWFTTVREMGNLYNWARQKKEIQSRMDLVKNNFNVKEKAELRQEGFLI